jgi:hypothetical protein
MVRVMSSLSQQPPKTFSKPAKLIPTRTCSGLRAEPGSPSAQLTLDLSRSTVAMLANKIGTQQNILIKKNN